MQLFRAFRYDLIFIDTFQMISIILLPLADFIEFKKSTHSKPNFENYLKDISQNLTGYIVLGSNLIKTPHENFNGSKNGSGSVRIR